MRSLPKVKTVILVSLFSAFFSALFSTGVYSQEQQYITDRIFVPIRSGAGGDYRILNKGLPSGTALTFYRLSEDGVWAEVETTGGTRGWLRVQYLQAAMPTVVKLKALQEQFDDLEQDRDKLLSTLNGLEAATYSSNKELATLRTDLKKSAEELEKLRELNGTELALDTKNSALLENIERQKTEIEVLKLENFRLTDRIENNQIIDGALAVLVGVLLAVFGPRLIPQRRKNDGWR